MPKAHPIQSPRLRAVRSRFQPVPQGSPRLVLTLEVGLLILCLCLGLFGSWQWPAPGWALVALANFIWMASLLLRIEPRATVLALPQLVNNLSTMVALVMIERGGEMFELGLVGRPGPWSNALNLYHLAFYIGLVGVLGPILRSFAGSSLSGLVPVYDRYARVFALLALALSVIIGLALIYRGLRSGFPLLQGTDRFAFRRFSADKVTLYALNLKFVIAYALGFVAFALPISRVIKISGGIAFAALILIFFLFGDKFFTQLSAIAAFFAPYLYREHASVRRNLLRYAAMGSAALTLVMGVTLFIYSNGFRETTSATSKRLTDRMVGQGELWYLQSSIGAPLLRWDRELTEGFAESLSVKSVDLFANKRSLGANYFSNRYAPDYLRLSLQNNAGSVTYTEATAAMGLVLFGWLGGAAMMGVLGAVFGLACAYIAFAIETRSMISAVFVAYVYMQTRMSIVQAAPWVVGSIYSLRWLTVIFVIEVALIMIGRNAKSRTMRGWMRDRPRSRQEQPS